MPRKAKLMAVLMLLSFHNLACAQGDEYTVRTVLEDGTTFLHTYNESRQLIREEIIITSGRHKTTYFDSGGNPKYGVVETGTGYFGLIYYDEGQAPVFKFWDYGNNDAIVQFYSRNLEPIGSVKIVRSDGVRKVIWSDKSGKFHQSIYLTLLMIFACLSIGMIFGIMIGRRKRTS